MDTTLEAVRRTQFGRNEAGRLRREGRIPAVLYGGGSGETESLSVDPKELSRLMHSESGLNTLISLKLDGAEGARVLLKEYQLHPVSHALLHADFYRVAMDKVIRVTVPVQLQGEAEGVKVQGGIVEFLHRDVAIECLPGDIPEHVTVDISDLMVSQGVRVRDLEAGAWKPVSEPDMLLVHIVPPRLEAEPEVDEEAAAAEVPEEGEGGTEPEVIKKGKAEDESPAGE